MCLHFAEQHLACVLTFSGQPLRSYSQSTDLMHDVSLRSAANFMDAYNLTVVLCPNLVAGSNVLRDVSMCNASEMPLLFAFTNPADEVASDEGKTTLGAVIKLCIQRYYEVFDEVRDRSEAVPGQTSSRGEGATSSETSSISEIQGRNREGRHDDDEDIDDAMLVMPIGPSRNHDPSSAQNGATSSVDPSPSESQPLAYIPRQRPRKSDVRSMHAIAGENWKNIGNGTSGHAYASMSKARSLISIDKAGSVGTAGRRGSIAIGRGTSRKSSGAAVEALSITAAGFFASPGSVPPVPPL